MVRQTLHGALLLILLLLPASPALCAACMADQCPMRTPADCHDMAPGHDMAGHGMAGHGTVESGGSHAGHSQAAAAHHPTSPTQTCGDTAASAAPAPDCCVSEGAASGEEQAVLTPASGEALAISSPALAERCEPPLRARGSAREGPLLRAPSPLYTLHSALLI